MACLRWRSQKMSLRRRLVFHGGKRATVSIGELSLQDLSGVGSRLADLLEGAGINLAEEVGA